MSSAVCPGCSSHGGCQVAIRDEVRCALQIFGDGFCGLFGSFAVRRLDGDDEFARVGEMLLVKFQPLNGGNIRRQQVENFDIKMQSRESGDNRNEQQQPPPTKPMTVHGKNSPSKVSPVRGFSRRHELVSARVNFQLPPGWLSRSARGN